ncbi:MAG: Rrf2 family transcriptional regulator [Anaerolineales bacterium]|nr:Rrf2 family transcriptional regulator [Anaerolineales bacterium]MCX7607616.1 Rrf2 family transcriptional regulator [Anaerolineales bacterium]MDW8226855.1 Rrf2 family transcriptional regulator [Anaerolineales bacterium]
MQITRQADYAIRAVHYLSRVGNQRAATSTVAKEMKIPPSFLAKIISQLSIAGIVQTSRGAHGGVRLARPPEEITLLDVVEAIDGPIHLNECVADPAKCEFSEYCIMHPVWVEAQQILAERLRSTTFANLKQQE